MGDNWKETSDMYTSLISKPRMTEKLLRKPPFRFLHDSIMATIAATGYAADLFTDDQKDSSKVADRDSKVRFLQKIINFVSQTLGQPIDCRPSKVVAGQDADATNVFLQGLFIAATGQFTQQEPPKQERKKRREQGKQQESKQQARAKARQAKKREEAKKKQEQKALQEAKAQEEAKKKEAKKREEDARRKEEENKKKEDDAKRKEEEKKKEAMRKREEQKKGKREPKREEGRRKQEEEKTEPPKVERPTTASRGPPKIRSTVVEQEAKKPTGGAGVIMEGGNQEQDDNLFEQGPSRKGVALNSVQQEKQGKLTRDILREQNKPKKVQIQREVQDSELGGNEGKHIKLNRIRGTRGEKKTNVVVEIADVENIKQAIQLLCQSTNPLGKSMEFVSDDIDSMKQEHEKWKVQYQEAQSLMEEQKRITEEQLQPFYDKLAEIEEQIRDRQIKINYMKAKTLKNEQVIKGLLQNVVSSK